MVSNFHQFLLRHIVELEMVNKSIVFGRYAQERKNLLVILLSGLAEVIWVAEMGHPINLTREGGVGGVACVHGRNYKRTFLKP